MLTFWQVFYIFISTEQKLNYAMLSHILTSSEAGETAASEPPTTAKILIIIQIIKPLFMRRLQGFFVILQDYALDLQIWDSRLQVWFFLIPIKYSNKTNVCFLGLFAHH